MATFFIVNSQIPAYYSDVDLNLTGTSLRDELATKIINTHTTNLSYGWTTIQQTDLDPNDSSKVLLLYGSDDTDGNYVTDETRSKNSNGGTAGTHWNREHTFPKSLGSPNLGTSGPGADVHHLRAADVTLNANRGSLKFSTGSGAAGTSGSGFYPGDEWKGDVARMIMYMYLRYGTRTLPSAVTIGTTNSVDANMIDLLLDWNAADPVSQYEKNRNPILETAQGNRNPFIDNPALATEIWGGTQAEDLFAGAAVEITDCSELFFSEYIEGSGDNKFLEIYNPTTSVVNLNTYSIEIYQNGSATANATLGLTGSISAGGTYVIENSAESLMFSSANLSTASLVMQFNGDDALALKEGTTIIDVIGQIGFDPGSQWAGTTCTLGTGEAVLRRNVTVQTGDNNGSDAFDPDTEWTCSATDDTSNLGSYTNNCANQEINIKGNGVSIASGTTATSPTNDTDFGSTDTASGTVTKTFTIENLGGSTLTLSANPTITTGDASSFSLSANPSLTIAASSSTTFNITFNPTTDGLKTTTITVSSDDADEATYTFNISGTGTTGGGNCGSETFDNSNAPAGTYGDGNFTGDNSVVWTYVGARDDEGYEIDGTGIMLRNTSSKITSSTVSGGIGDFTMELKKGFTGSGNRQVELYVNNVLKGTSIAWDNTTTQAFSVNGINELGDVVIEIRNATARQVILDNISWTCYAPAAPEIDIQGNGIAIADGETATSAPNDTDFGSISTSSGSVIKTYTILNTGTSDLTLSGNPTISGADASQFSVTANPSLIINQSASTNFSVTFNPNSDGLKNATITINSDDADEGTYTFNISGTGISGAVDCANITGATLFSQDFETSPATPELTYTATNTAFSLGLGNTPSDPMYADGSRGIQVSNTTGTVEFDSFDSSSFSNLEFSIRLASFSGTSGNGAETSDYVSVSVSTDNGTTYSEELTVTGAAANNARWSFTSGTGTANTVYDGNNTTTTFAPSGTGDRTTDGYSTLNITSLPSSTTLKIKIELKNSSTNEFWVIDDAKIIGDSSVVATWNGTTWSGASPANNVKIVFENDYDMNTQPSLESCECEVKTGNTVTVTSGKYLRIENDLINNGTITVNDSGSLVQIAETAAITGSGTYTVKRNTTNLPSRHVFTYWSSPLVAATLGQIAADAHLYYSFNESGQNWVSANAATAMTSGVGYAVEGPNSGVSYPGSYTATFTGAKFNTGDITVPLVLGTATHNSAVDNANLVGNPYPSTLNAALFLSSNSNINGTLYFWSHNTDASTSSEFTTDDYVSWNGTGGVANCTGCTAPTGNIASGQGFFVIANTATTLNFTNEMRLNGNNNNFYRPTKNVTSDKIWLNLSSEDSFSQLLIGFLKNATDGEDRLYDGHKFKGNNNTDFYSIINGKPFSIQGKPKLNKDEEIPLGFSIKNPGTFTIKIDHFDGVAIEDKYIYLKDNLLGIVHNLNASEYKFSESQTGTFDNRFSLFISKNQNVLAIVDESYVNNIIVQDSNFGLTVKSVNNKVINHVAVYNLLGKEIIFNKQSNTSINIKSNRLKNNAIYFLKIQLENGQIIHKKLLKK